MNEFYLNNCFGKWLQQVSIALPDLTLKTTRKTLRTRYFIQQLSEKIDQPITTSLYNPSNIFARARLV